MLRFLYCHEWMHTYGVSARPTRKRVGETACDRFALFNYRRRTVTVEDAEAALTWRQNGDEPAWTARWGARTDPRRPR